VPPKPKPLHRRKYRAFQEAYDFFNAELFAGSLPHVLVTLQCHANYRPPRRLWVEEQKCSRAQKGRPPSLFAHNPEPSVTDNGPHYQGLRQWYGGDILSSCAPSGIEVAVKDVTTTPDVSIKYAVALT
jgi:hypothetical protein